MCGVRGTLVLADGVTLTEEQARAAIESRGLAFGTFERREIDRPIAAYVVETPGSL